MPPPLRPAPFKDEINCVLTSRTRPNAALDKPIHAMLETQKNRTIPPFFTFFPAIPM
jgi:hypothetical protein